MRLRPERKEECDRRREEGLEEEGRKGRKEKKRERDARSQKKGRKEETVTVRGRLLVMF